MRNDLLYFLALGMIPGIGGVTAKKLISYCGGAEAVFYEKKAILQKIPGIGKAISAAISNKEVFDLAEAEIAFMEKHGIRALCYIDKEYPGRLKHCEDGPILLFVRGEVNLNNQKVVGVVGTRNITDYGKKKCKEIIGGLVSHQALIVSGLAYGVDALAHKCALDSGLPTVAVLGHGLDRVYPSMHDSLARRMVDNQGGLVSDFPSGTKPDRENFPKRNRIIAGLCDAVVVIEAAVTGGALITANIANTYNRDVFALPGRTSDAYSMGCNRLIKTHKANLLETVADLEYVMNWQSRQTPKQTQKTLFADLDESEKELVAFLGKHPGGAGIDHIAAGIRMGVGKASAMLLNLEFKDVVYQMPGKCFALTKHYTSDNR